MATYNDARLFTRAVLSFCDNHIEKDTFKVFLRITDDDDFAEEVKMSSTFDSGKELFPLLISMLKNGLEKFVSGYNDEKTCSIKLVLDSPIGNDKEFELKFFNAEDALDYIKSV